jgi:hypothetical protein
MAFSHSHTLPGEFTLAIEQGGSNHCQIGIPLSNGGWQFAMDSPANLPTERHGLCYTELSVEAEFQGKG